MNVIVTTHKIGSPVPADDLSLSFINGESTQVIDVVSVSTPPDLVALPAPRRKGVLARVARVVRAATGAPARLASILICAITRGYTAVRYETSRTLRAHSYQPRHVTRRTWYARQRSTSQHNAACRAQAKEDELRYPPEFISLLETFIETLRYEEDILHPTRSPGRHFICS